MDFSELINGILSSDTLQNISNIALSIVGVIVTVLYNKLKTKLSNTTKDTNSTVSKLLNEIEKITEYNKEVKTQNDKLTKETEDLKQCILAMGDIVSSSFMSSKAVSSETKIAISKSVSKLAELGVDVKAANQVAQEAKQTLEKVVEIKEIVTKTNEDNNALAEDTANKTLDIYNDILSSNEQ